MAKARRSGSAMLGAEDAAAGELVLFEATVEHENGAILRFSCVARSPTGGSLAHLAGKPLVLEVIDGPTFGVRLVRLSGSEAVLALRDEEAA